VTRAAACFGVAVLCHAGLFGICALASRHASVPDESEKVDVDVADPLLESAPAAAEPQPARFPPPAKPRARPQPLASRPTAPSADAPAVEPAPTAPTLASHPAAGPAHATAIAPLGSSFVAKPRYRSNPEPDYPLASLRRHEEGTVLLNVQVEPDGRPSSISLRQSSGHPLLDEAALDAVRRWTFEPALAAGTPVSSLAIVPVRFSTADR